MHSSVRSRSHVRLGSKVGFEKTSKTDGLQHPVVIGPTEDSPFTKVRGSATVRRRTDEIMRLTRAVG